RKGCPGRSASVREFRSPRLANDSTSARRASIYQLNCPMISPLLDGLLDPKHVALNLRGSTVGEVVWEIVELLRESGELNKPSEFFEAVMAREEKASTVADGGVAFPHARTELVDQILLGIGRRRTGVVFDGQKHLVHLIFVISAR